MVTKLVLFDLDDTLCDYAGARALRLRRAFATAFEADPGASTPDFDALIVESIGIHPHGAEHFAELLARHGIANSDAAMLARRWYQTNRFHGLRLFDDAIATLNFARSGGRDRRLGLITNGPSDVQRAKIALLEVESHFDFIVISGEFGVAKPEPAIFVHTLRQANVTVDEAVFVGDSPEFDIAGAHAMGIRSIWVNRTGLPWKHHGFSPDHEVSDLTALRRLL